MGFLVVGVTSPYHSLMDQHIEIGLLRETFVIAGEEIKEPAKVSGLRATPLLQAAFFAAFTFAQRAF